MANTVRADGTLASAAHVQCPGICRVAGGAAGNRWRFVPINCQRVH